jgi:hypothetical protein
MNTPANAVRSSSADPVLENLDRLLPDLEALYTDVHAHPELSMQETRTAGLAHVWCCLRRALEKSTRYFRLVTT